MPQEFVWHALSASCSLGDKAVPAFNIPYGNDLQIPSVFGKRSLYTVKRIYHAAKIMFLRGAANYRDLINFFGAADWVKTN